MSLRRGNRPEAKCNQATFRYILTFWLCLTLYLTVIWSATGRDQEGQVFDGIMRLLGPRIDPAGCLLRHQSRPGQTKQWEKTVFIVSKNGPEQVLNHEMKQRPDIDKWTYWLSLLTYSINQKTRFNSKRSNLLYEP